jgi:ankyrin repeat protein
MLRLCAVIAAARDSLPKAPLCHAALYGDMAQVRALLGRGANPKVRDEQGDTPLMRVASVRGHVAVRDHVKQPDYEGVVKLLLDKGAAINARNAMGARRCRWRRLAS